MKLQVVGASYRGTSIALRERLAFSADQCRRALTLWRRTFAQVEAALLSTCNRVEFYTANGEDHELPGLEAVADFLADFHQIEPRAVRRELYQHRGEPAIRHLFTVTASLDSMVLGEPQILNQVKQAYQLAVEQQAAGPRLHSAFQAALTVARKVASETAVHKRRVSIPSVAVADFARQIFERFDDKHVLVIGAGEMAAETLRYLRDEGAHQITIVNRRVERADELAELWRGKAVGWDQLTEALATADLVVSTTGASVPIVDCQLFARIQRSRLRQPLFILDLAVPRDFEPAIGHCPDVYLYSVDDLQAACERNRRERDRELPAALRIIDAQAQAFREQWYHRAARPVIEQLRRGWDEPKEKELTRLLNKLPELDPHAREEIRRAFDRLVNKLLHPPLESLRDESRRGVPRALLSALTTLFKLNAS